MVLHNGSCRRRNRRLGVAAGSAGNGRLMKSALHIESRPAGLMEGLPDSRCTESRLHPSGKGKVRIHPADRSRFLLAPATPGFLFVHMTMMRACSSQRISCLPVSGVRDPNRPEVKCHSPTGLYGVCGRWSLLSGISLNDCCLIACIGR